MYRFKCVCARVCVMCIEIHRYVYAIHIYYVSINECRLLFHQSKAFGKTNSSEQKEKRNQLVTPETTIQHNRAPAHTTNKYLPMSYFWVNKLDSHPSFFRFDMLCTGLCVGLCLVKYSMRFIQIEWAKTHTHTTKHHKRKLFFIFRFFNSMAFKVSVKNMYDVANHCVKLML